jgi:SAM-dependent methyltransferase
MRWRRTNASRQIQHPAGTFDSWSLDFFYREFPTDPLLASFYKDSGYANLGYWDDAAETASEACDHLVDRLIADIGGRRRDILDVACGWGGTTQRLSSHFVTGNVSAINTSPVQLAAAAARVPAATFHCMDAASMTFSARSFDAVLCVEAAFHFNTRRRFLEEAFRVLRPGGVLALSDFIVLPGTPTVPRWNDLPSAESYAVELAEVGFRSVQVQQALEPCLGGFRLHFSDHITANLALTSWLVCTRDLYFTNVMMPAVIKDVVLVTATRK